MGRVAASHVIRRVITMAALVIVAAGCGGGRVAGPPSSSTTNAGTVTTTTDVFGDAAADLAAARARWAAAAPATHHYVFVDDCGECEPQSTQVVVWDGERVSSDEAPSVERLFGSIDDAIAAGRNVEATYDELGVPTEVWIDQEARAYDGGTHWVIQDFAARLPGEAASPEALQFAQTRWTEHRPTAYEFHTQIVCDCELAGALWTKVVGDRIVDHRIEVDTEASLSPITIDEMLDDLAELLTTGLSADGVRVTGSAQFDAELGYPVWIGLDIAVQDPGGELAYLPPRLAIVITDFAEVEPDADDAFGSGLADLEEARGRWVTAGLDDYRYELSVHDLESADVSGVYTVAVEGGDLVTITEGGIPAETPPVPAYTIEEWFDLIALWTQSGIQVEALYDADTGHPVIVARRSEPPLIVSIDDLRSG